MAGIPIRLAPLPGEALDSWLGAYADLLHVTVRDIFRFAGIDCGRAGRGQLSGKPWLHRLGEADLAALSAATGVPAQALAGMTLARYQGTGLAEVTAQPGLPSAPRWWRHLAGSRYCPRCLAANGGRWMLAWRIPWAFACTGCQALLADTCPDCGRRHRSTRPGRPREPGRCDLAGLPLPPWRPPAGTPACGSDPAATPAVALPAGGHVLTAQQHVDAVIAALLSAQGQPAEAAALRQYLDDACAVARAAISAAGRTASFPAAVTAVLDELGARTGPGKRVRQPAPRTSPAARARHRVRRHRRRHHAARPARRPRPRHRRLARRPRRQPRPDDLPGAGAHRLEPGQPRPAGLPGRAAGGPGRHRAPAALPRRRRPGPHPRPRPRPGTRRSRAVTDVAGLGAAPAAALGPRLPALPGPARGHARHRGDRRRIRHRSKLLGLEPSRLGKLGNFTALLRQHGALEPVTAAICQLARSLDQHGAPVIDYARRRRQGSLCQAPLDAGSWSSQRDLLLAQHGRPAPAGAPAHEQLARLRLIELLTGTHPRYLPGPLQLPRQRGPDYAAFVFTMPGQLDLCLRRQASALLSQAGISEPVTWEPPPGWAPGIPRPGPDPDAASAGQRIRRLLAIPGQPDLQHAARQLGTTTARLSRQVRQLEDIAGTALLRTGPDGRLTLTAHGRLFARDVHPVLEHRQPGAHDTAARADRSRPSALAWSIRPLTCADPGSPTSPAFANYLRFLHPRPSRRPGTLAR